MNAGADPIMAILAFVGITIAGLGCTLALTALTRGVQWLSRSSAAAARAEPKGAPSPPAPEPSWQIDTIPTVAEPRRLRQRRAAPCEHLRRAPAARPGPGCR